MKNRMLRFGRARTPGFANRIACRAGSLLLCLLAAMVAGCSTAKPKPEAKTIHERGWIGGEFKLAQSPFRWNTMFGTREEYVYELPRGLASSNHAGILITALGSNAPARLAGLREGDLILDFNHQPVTTLKAFHQIVDRMDPGTALPVTAWREGKSFECSVPVGRETYKNWGTFSIGLGLPNLSDFGHFDLWPNPGFDLWALGFEPNSDDRTELASAESIYRRGCSGGKYTPSDPDWKTWLVIFHLSRGKNIESQESVPVASESK
jgi:hypothetical protein